MYSLTSALKLKVSEVQHLKDHKESRGNSPRIRKPPFEYTTVSQSCMHVLTAGMEINHYCRSFVVIIFQNQTRVRATPQTIESCFLRLGRQRCHWCYSWSQVGFVHGGWAHCSRVSMVEKKQGKWSESLITWRAFSCYTVVCRQWFKGGMTSYGACLYTIFCRHPFCWNWPSLSSGC